jgi:hypothetical protein
MGFLYFQSDMTNPTSPVSVSQPYSTTLLPPDIFRTIVALAIIALTIGGWIYVMMIPIDRFALSAQTGLWWIEQVTKFVLALVAIAIVLRKRSFLNWAFWLTIYSLIFTVMRWIFQFREGQLTISVALILYALFIWRLSLTRRTVFAQERAVAA